MSLRRRQERKRKKDTRVSFVCPFCKKQAFAGFARGDIVPGGHIESLDFDPKKPSEGVPIIEHEIPPCKEFLEMEAADYLHLVNIHHGAHN